jgi:hypothetical protein
MIRGTTPTHTFGIPISEKAVKNIEVTYKQDGRIVVKKGIDDVVITGNAVKVTLTQQETLRFMAGIKAKVGIRVITAGGKAIGSKRSINIKVKEGNSNEVLT